MVCVDTDTTSGTVTPNLITPTFEYRLNSSDTWHPITTIADVTGNSTNATSNKHVDPAAYTTYTAYWNAATDIPNTYTTQAQVRVTANDNEIIYNIAHATTSPFTLETTPPSTTLHIDGASSTSTVTLVATSSISLYTYLVSNNASGTPDGVNGQSGVVQSTAGSSLALHLPWTLDTATSTHTVTSVIADIDGNRATTTVLAPAVLQNFEAHDISNATIDAYQLFLAWSLYTASDPRATFKQYEIWRSTDGSDFGTNAYRTITNQSLNYFLDYNLSSTTSYYYKERTIDQDDDRSAFTPTSKVTPSGQGCSSLPPEMSVPVVDPIGNTSATITWNTNTLANAVVNYGVGTFGSTASSTSYLNTHTVYLTNLTPRTTYQFKVTSTDICRNTGTEDNGYTFTTVSGPTISNVQSAPTYDSATITWDTDTSSDTHVTYSTSSGLAGATTLGSDELATTTDTGGISHAVTLSSLQPLTTYYFYVTSTDAAGHLSKDNNAGAEYSFTTGRDTTPPVISNIKEPVVDSQNIVVSWQTDKPTDSQIEYGTVASTSDGAYDKATTLDTTLSTFHVATLANLAASTAYYFRIMANDANSNRAYSDEQKVTTTASDVAVIYETSSGSGTTNNPAPPPTPTAPAITSVVVEPINTFDATIRVVADRDVSVGVDYGVISSSTPTAGYTDNTSSMSLSTTQKIQLKNLLPATTYHYTITIISKDGLRTQSTPATFTTKFLSEDLGNLSTLTKAADIQSRLLDAIQSALPSINPPYQGTPTVSSTTQSSAIITWGTNLKTYARVDYETDDSYEKSGHLYGTEIAQSDATTTTHQVTLTNLKPSTKYHFSTQAFIFPQAIAKSADYTFTTKASPITPQIFDIKTDSFRIIWSTDTTTSSSVDFTDRATGKIQTLKDAAFTKVHDLTAPNLVSGHTYDLKAYGYDQDGNLITAAPLTITTAVDKTVPQVTSLRIDSTLVPGRTDIVQSIVSWKTDKPATSVVYYEEGSGTADAPLKNKVENDTGFAQDHVVLLPNLKPATIYRVQVSSTDQAGNTETLPVRTIVTPQQSESIIDIIFKNFSTTFDFIK